VSASAVARVPLQDRATVWRMEGASRDKLHAHMADMLAEPLTTVPIFNLTVSFMAELPHPGRSLSHTCCLRAVAPGDVQSARQLAAAPP